MKDCGITAENLLATKAPTASQEAVAEPKYPLCKSMGLEKR